MSATAEAQKRSRTSRADTEQLESRVTALESELADVERQLADPALYAGTGNHTEATRLAGEQTRLRTELDTAMLAWEAAAG
jgi:hypothetical protein